MGHLAVETLLGQTARDVADAKEANHTDDTLREFGKCTIALRTVLHQDRPRSEGGIPFHGESYQGPRDGLSSVEEEAWKHGY